MVRVLKIGLIAGAFDPFPHPGVLDAMQQAMASGLCETIVVALHVDPHAERAEKRTPAMTVAERRSMVEAIGCVSHVVEYRTEAELLSLLVSLRPDVRILGDDYRGRRFTGDEAGRELGIPIFYARRTPGWSGTEFAARIAASTKGKGKDG